ncbi:MAG: amphi-Trp domain-containing protein [Desulfobacterales bacterium]
MSVIGDFAARWCAVEMEIEDVISYLESLSDGLKEERIVVEDGDSAVNLNPPSFVNLEIKVKQKNKKKSSPLKFPGKNME